VLEKRVLKRMAGAKTAPEKETDSRNSKIMMIRCASLFILFT
jgi:hypothetical protein